MKNAIEAITAEPDRCEQVGPAVGLGAHDQRALDRLARGGEHWNDWKVASAINSGAQERRLQQGDHRAGFDVGAESARLASVSR